MDDFKLASETLEAIVTSIAIIVGGFWAYYAFVRQRSAYPSVDLDFGIDHYPVPEKGLRLVHVEVKLKNLGTVVSRSPNAELQLRHIIPIPQGIYDELESGFDPVREDDQEIEWDVIAKRSWEWRSRDFEIEPGEKDALHSDFVIDEDVQVIGLCFFLQNGKKTSRGLGWTKTQFVALTRNEL